MCDRIFFMRGQCAHIAHKEYGIGYVLMLIWLVERIGFICVGWILFSSPLDKYQQACKDCSKQKKYYPEEEGKVHSSASTCMTRPGAKCSAIVTTSLAYRSAAQSGNSRNALSENHSHRYA